MAKKKMGLENVGKGNANSVFDLIKSFDDSAEILEESKVAVIRDYIGTGNYMLNACMAGSIFKGAPCGRVVTLSGDPATGKSYLAVSMCREAQKLGYTPIYMDSEGAVDIESIERLGCDPKNFVLRQVTTVSEVSTFMTNMLKTVLDLKEEDRPKIMFVLDSLGNLTSTKELNDILEATGKKDMQRSQEIKALFRTVTTSLSKAGALMVVCTHTYSTQDLYSKKVVTGGTGIGFSSSVTIMLSNAKLDDKASDKIASTKVGDFTKNGTVVTATPYKSRFTIPQKVQFQIPFFKSPNPYVGLEKYLTWENSGVVRGEIITQKEYDKLSDSDKSKCYEMADENGEVCYARPKDTARTIVVKHLGTKIPVAELWSPKVFTDELLHKLDEEVIKPNFELPSSDSFADVEELVDVEE